MNTSTIIGLVNNVALLLALGVLYDTLGPRPRGGKPTIQQALAGIILGAIGIAVMLTPWEFAPGVVFDTRSVLLSVSGLFFGTAPTLAAVLMTGAFRLYQGGVGAWAGAAVIVTSGGIGMAWRHLRRRKLEDISVRELYVLGLVVHIAMLLWMLSLPWPLAMSVLSTISLPVMVIYPVGTALLGWLMVNRDARKRAEAALETYARQQVALFQLSAGLAVTLDEADVCQEVVRGLHETLGYDYLGLFLVDESTGERVLHSSVGWVDPLLDWRIPPGQGLSERPLLDGQLHYTPDVTCDARYIPGLGSGAEVDVPLRVGERVLGVLVVESKKPNTFDQGDFAVLTAAANQAGMAIERAREHRAVKEAEARYHSLFDRVPLGLYRSTPEGQFLDANPALLWMLGYPDAETLLAANAVSAYVDPDDRERWQALVEREGIVRDFEVRLRRRDGTVIWMRESTRAVRDADGRVLQYEGSLEDITERKQAEETLRESEERFRTIVETNPGLLMITDLRGKFTYISPNCERFTGYTQEELLTAQEWWVHEDDASRTVELFARVISEGVGGRDFEYRAVKKDGEVWLASSSWEPLKDEAGAIYGVVTLTFDITERKRAEEELRRHREHLEELVDKRTKELRDAQEELLRKEKLAILGQLAGGVGHELRNPLGVISNAVYYLKMVLPDADEAIKESLEMISAEVRNSTKIISDLLDFSRTRIPDREEAAVSELAAEALKKRPPPENVEATTEIAPDLPPVYVDPRQMGQVLGNLVVNAYQAMKEGGKLTISAQAEEGQVSLSVADTGCGIPEKNMTKIFEPLFTTRARGIGLGLAVSKSLVEANGGSIEVKSEEGKGSTFTVRLPTGEGVA